MALSYKEKRIDDVKNMQMVLIRVMMREWKLTGDEMADLIKNYDLLDIIDSGYEIFNSTGTPGILNEIENYIKMRGGTIKTKRSRHYRRKLNG